MSFVLLDIGGTFAKAVVVSSAEEFRGLAPESVQRVPLPDFLDTEPQAREIDPQSLMDVVAQVLERAQAASPSIGEIRGVLVSGQMAGLACVDREGRALRPLISWQDQRGTAIDAFASALHENDLQALGEGVRVGLPALTLRTMTISDDMYVTSLLGFVAGSLAKVKAPFLHSTDAASWGLVDLTRRDWHPEALAFSGVSRTMLPEVVWGMQPVGTSEPLNCPVWCAVGDQQAALLGVGLKADEVSVNLATGCQVSLRSDHLRFVPGLQTRPFFDNDFLLTRTHLPAGRLLGSAMRDAYGGDSEEVWNRAQRDLSEGVPDRVVLAAVTEIAEAITESLTRADPKGQMRVVWSGGLAERFAPIRGAVEARQSRASRISNVPEAALMGLAQLIARTSRLD
jgi:xylulokinase